MGVEEQLSLKTIECNSHLIVNESNLAYDCLPLSVAEDLKAMASVVVGTPEEEASEAFPLEELPVEKEVEVEEVVEHSYCWPSNRFCFQMCCCLKSSSLQLFLTYLSSDSHLCWERLL